MGGELSIGRLIGHFAATRPDVVALVEDGSADVMTWAELDRATNRLARAYAAAGVVRDSVVAVVLPNSAAFVRACVAAWKLGATALPLSVKLPPAERERILALAPPALVVESEPDSAGLAGTELPDVSPTYWKALTSGGSTGKPKLIVSHDQPKWDPGQAVVEYMHADGVQLVVGPLYHNAAFVYAMRGLFSGSRLVVMRGFDAARVLRLVDEHAVTWMQLVPTMMNRIWKLPPEVRAAADLSSLRTLLHVGGPCAPWLKEAWIDWLGPDRVVEVYAGTENQGITMITGREWLTHRGSVGRAIRGSRFQVQDEHGDVVPPGVVGEVFLMPEGGPGSTYHYVGATPRGRDGWESLGDLGHYDEDGYLYLDDRSTDCIVTGGANVYPAEVEGALDSYPGVRASAVIGLPDEDLGQRVVAIVEADQHVTAAALDEHLRSLLAPYKRPRAYELTRSALRDEAGKVRRAALRAERRTSPTGATS
ncbi:AMP-binding protein [Actinophytocola algeriensis]|uniref:Bile acid-coenzyme A ligase n=1 Tax=Actinophytocola algeriensis TaxID=1768010 RepID=A0A7W7VD83_9PSEU|nr:AMP-binding protein [Actinophytocola algeriensis]MBB4905938.1 bile acid-coenzyme A ligase [Actinophytocola algeriensis]MBE1472377.1 bile acid-coenzyme A ligase [Actinophytocola algeriensis]